MSGHGGSRIRPVWVRQPSVSAGAYHSLALKRDGTVVAWGANYAGQAIVPEGLPRVTAIGEGPSASLAVVGGCRRTTRAA